MRFPELMFPSPYCPKCGNIGKLINKKDRKCKSSWCEVDWYNKKFFEIPVVLP